MSAGLGTVVVAGVGAVGSRVAAWLAPDAGTMILIDRDLVGPENLPVCAGLLRRADLGGPKVDAVAALCRELGPGEVLAVHRDVAFCGPDLLALASVVVLCLDNAGALACSVEALRLSGNRVVLLQAACDAGSFAAVVRAWPDGTPGCPLCLLGTEGRRRALTDLTRGAEGGCSAPDPARRASAAAAALAAGLTVDLAARIGRAEVTEPVEHRALLGPGRLLKASLRSHSGCDVCAGGRAAAVPADAVSPDSSMGALCRLAAEELGDEALMVLRIGQGLCREILCPSCGAEGPTLRLVGRMGRGEGPCACDVVPAALHVERQLRAAELFDRDETLAAIGFASGDEIRFENSNRSRSFPVLERERNETEKDDGDDCRS